VFHSSTRLCRDFGTGLCGSRTVASWEVLLLLQHALDGISCTRNQGFKLLTVAACCCLLLLVATRVGAAVIFGSLSISWDQSITLASDCVAAEQWQDGVCCWLMLLVVISIGPHLMHSHLECYCWLGLQAFAALLGVAVFYCMLHIHYIYAVHAVRLQYPTVSQLDLQNVLQQDHGAVVCIACIWCCQPHPLWINCMYTSTSPVALQGSGGGLVDSEGEGPQGRQQLMGLGRTQNAISLGPYPGRRCLLLLGVCICAAFALTLCMGGVGGFGCLLQHGLVLQCVSWIPSISWGQSLTPVPDCVATAVPVCIAATQNQAKTVSAVAPNYQRTSFSAPPPLWRDQGYDILGGGLIDSMTTLCRCASG
jgi:hypothetical protein